MRVLTAFRNGSREVLYILYIHLHVFFLYYTSKTPCYVHAFIVNH